MNPLVELSDCNELPCCVVTSMLCCLPRHGYADQFLLSHLSSVKL
eukprot:COSAG02_NODE_1865_length_10601_cov_116.823748_2_plen_45_part_00